jgi:hypothetical protein
MTIFDDFHQLKRRSLPEWQKALSEIRDQMREKVQDHGEIAAFSGFVAGIIVVLFFKIFSWLFFCIAVLAAYVWLTAPDGK